MSGEESRTGTTVFVETISLWVRWMMGADVLAGRPWLESEMVLTASSKARVESLGHEIFIPDKDPLLVQEAVKNELLNR